MLPGMALWDTAATPAEREATLAALQAEHDEALAALGDAESALIEPQGWFTAAHEAVHELLQRRRRGEPIEPGSLRAAYDERMHAGIHRHPYKEAHRAAKRWFREVRLEWLLASGAAKREAERTAKRKRALPNPAPAPTREPPVQPGPILHPIEQPSLFPE